MWEDRNDDQHGRDSIESAAKEREILMNKIHQLYTRKETIDPEDRRLYHKPEEQWKEETSKKNQRMDQSRRTTHKEHEEIDKNSKSGYKATTDRKFFCSVASRRGTEKSTYLHT